MMALQLGDGNILAVVVALLWVDPQRLLPIGDGPLQKRLLARTHDVYHIYRNEFRGQWNPFMENGGGSR